MQGHLQALVVVLVVHVVAAHGGRGGMAGLRQQGLGNAAAHGGALRRTQKPPKKQNPHMMFMVLAYSSASQSMAAS